jgi:putative DNA methylase
MTKLIEVALPVEAISAASRRDKDRKTGTIKNVHKWFAPMPTPAWRALLFASLVDDPGDELARKELLALVERLVPEDGGPPHQDDLDEAKRLIAQSMGGHLPTVLDPFCGGGSTLVEAQRLGLPTIGSDLNPVPVLITRVLTELVPQVAGRPPLVGDPSRLSGVTRGPLDGLFADVRYYAERVSDRVWGEVGHLYPSPPGGGTVVAWLWARTVTCPNPACRAVAPLVSSFWLSKRKGSHTWIEPEPNGPGQPVTFHVNTGTGEPPPPTKTARGGTFRCATCNGVIPEAHVKTEGMAARLDAQLMAVAVDRNGSRRFLSPDEAGLPPSVARPDDAPELSMCDYGRWFSPPAFGMTTIADSFTNRQLVTLGTFADAVADSAGWVRLDGGEETYARTIASILGLCVGKLAMTNSTQVRWKIDSRNGSGGATAAFGKHALPMVWDVAESNPLVGAAGSWNVTLDSVLGGLAQLPQVTAGRAIATDARFVAREVPIKPFIATDPPYFAQIGYADLSDYFYVWHRRALRDVHPDLYATVATPKAAELIAAPYRHGGSKQAATKAFVEGFTETFSALKGASHADLPILVVYAHRQEERGEFGGATSAAWDSILTALLRAGLTIFGTWPIWASASTKQIGQGTNAVATYVVLVCRPASPNARVIDRQTLLGALRAEIPRAIRHLQEAAISAVDLGQATIGPGMAVFSRYKQVVEATGQPMTVRAALQLISQVRGEVLEQFAGDLDRETRWAMAWFKDHLFGEARFDVAETIMRTTNTAWNALTRAGIARSRAGLVSLVPRDELPDGWDPDRDQHKPVWEILQHVIKQLQTNGEQGAAGILRKVRREADAVRELAYWLFDVCERPNAAEAQVYDALVTSWPEIIRLVEAESSSPAGLFTT